jgi:hypothetical protein
MIPLLPAAIITAGHAVLPAALLTAFSSALPASILIACWPDLLANLLTPWSAAKLHLCTPSSFFDVLLFSAVPIDPKRNFACSSVSQNVISNVSVRDTHAFRIVSLCIPRKKVFDENGNHMYGVENSVTIGLKMWSKLKIRNIDFSGRSVNFVETWMQISLQIYS